jgi:anti-sigma28 factor (negative regulator of flagellin synthesis)
MKILDRNQLGIGGAGSLDGSGSTEAVGGRRNSADAAPAGSAQDRAEVSGLAGKLSEATSKDASQRATRVEKLRAAVAGGSHRVDAHEVSRGIVKDALAGDGKPVLAQDALAQEPLAQEASAKEPSASDHVAAHSPARGAGSKE